MAGTLAARSDLTDKGKVSSQVPAFQVRESSSLYSPNIALEFMASYAF